MGVTPNPSGYDHYSTYSDLIFSPSTTLTPSHSPAFAHTHLEPAHERRLPRERQPAREHRLRRSQPRLSGSLTATSTRTNDTTLTRTNTPYIDIDWYDHGHLYSDPNIHIHIHVNSNEYSNKYRYPSGY